MSIVIAIAPHPDDETLGCGGTLLKHVAQGDEVHWLVVTSVSEEQGFSAARVSSRDREIRAVAERYGFACVHELGFPTTRLDAMPMAELVGGISAVFGKIRPEIVYLPHRYDVHTDHAAVFDAVVSCTKWFRYPSVRRALVYETLSETDFSLNPSVEGFRPNVFVDITEFASEKIEIMGLFESEVGAHPFPRSPRAIRALADVRGAAAGYESAEAFILLRERL